MSDVESESGFIPRVQSKPSQNGMALLFQTIKQKVGKHSAIVLPGARVVEAFSRIAQHTVNKAATPSTRKSPGNAQPWRLFYAWCNVTGSTHNE